VRYGTSIAWADELGRGDVVRFATNLNEDKGGSNVTLRKGVNRKAAS
jgi:hypothetical protein